MQGQQRGIAVVVNQSDIAKANCAGQECPDKGQCRRYVTRIVTPVHAEWERQSGQWCSFDLERREFGTCANFVRWNGDRRAAG